MPKVVPVVGLQKLYVAKIIKDGIDGAEYDKPKYLEGIKEIGIKPKVNTDSFYAESVLWISESTLADIDVTVNITDLTDEDEAFLLGHKLADTGGIIKSADDEAPEVAILFKSLKGNGKSRFVVLYKGQFSISDDDAKSKEGKANFQTKKLKATFQPLHFNGRWQYKVDEDSTNAPEGLEKLFFTSVMMPKEKVA